MSEGETQPPAVASGGGGDGLKGASASPSSLQPKDNMSMEYLCVVSLSDRAAMKSTLIEQNDTWVML